VNSFSDVPVSVIHTQYPVLMPLNRELDLGSTYHILTVPNQISSPSDKSQ